MSTGLIINQPNHPQLCLRVVDDVELLSLLEAEVVLGAGLIVVQGDEQSHSSTCARNATQRKHSALGKRSPIKAVAQSCRSALCDVTKGVIPDPG